MRVPVQPAGTLACTEDNLSSCRGTKCADCDFVYYRHLHEIIEVVLMRSPLPRLHGWARAPEISQF
jgi:hypothetical protein